MAIAAPRLNPHNVNLRVACSHIERELLQTLMYTRMSPRACDAANNLAEGPEPRSHSRAVEAGPVVAAHEPEDIRVMLCARFVTVPRSVECIQGHIGPLCSMRRDVCKRHRLLLRLRGYYICVRS